MYLVQTKTLAELAGCWYEKEPPPSAPPPPASMTATIDTVQLAYDRGEPIEMPDDVIDTLVQHYLNEHIPTTWRLVTLARSGKAVRFVWRLPDT